MRRFHDRIPLPLLLSTLLLVAMTSLTSKAATATRVVLPNGLTVLVQERHTAPVVTVAMWYRVGSLEEETRAVALVAHPYGTPVIGWMSDLRRLTRDEVMAFYHRWYVPARAILVIAGDVATG